MPPFILQCVNDLSANAFRDPTDRPRSPHKGREQIAPSAAMPSDGVSAPVAPGMTEHHHARPTSSAHDPCFARIEGTVARHARQRKQEVCRGTQRGPIDAQPGVLVFTRRSRPERARDGTLYVRRDALGYTTGDGRARPICRSIARHITVRSGSVPNQRSNASAPCSTNMSSPSSATCPAAREARTQEVSRGV
jgi:hypothetical protein